MALEYDGQRIGAMQYNGVTIGEAMMDGQIVYRSSPYPLTGTFEIVNGEPLTPYDLFRHTVVEPGDFTGKITLESVEPTAIYWYLNGSIVTGMTGLTGTYTGLSVGDTISAAAAEFGNLNVSGTWSIVKA